MNRTFLAWTRTIHIYLTMAALALMLFFAVTGITANHEEWFGATTPHERVATGATPADAVARADKLRIVEHLRAKFGVTGALFEFNVDDPEQFVVEFRAPGYSAKAEIARTTTAAAESIGDATSRSSGQTKVTFRTFNLIARMNDLHRARDTGETWRVIVDAGGVLIILASVTGVILWIALPKRRKVGIAWAILGIAGSVAFYWVVVP
jgi:uncharacterized protein